ncbi:MAG: DNA methyltransferase [Nanoarchaeota archaeon]
MIGSSFRLEQQDAIDFLKTIGSDSVDLFITDPAYESLEKHRKIGTTTRLTKQWFDIFPNTRYTDLFTEMFRVLKNNRHCYVFCDQETMFVIKPIAEACGFKWKKALIWDKVAIGMGYTFRAQHEMIVYLEKGKRKLNSNSISDVLSYKRISKSDYPTQKPIDLAKVLINQSTFPGELIMDPFMGSGFVGVGSLQEKRLFWGNDISPVAYSLSSAKMLLDEY